MRDVETVPTVFVIVAVSLCAGPYKEEDEKVYHAYYQWVPIVLFFQALSFYFPHWMWKHMEGGRMKVCNNSSNNNHYIADAFLLLPACHCRFEQPHHGSQRTWRQGQSTG